MTQIDEENTLKIDPEQTQHQKNTDGHLGPICNTCGGFGFTLTFGGVSNSAGCRDCSQTGVASMTNAELQKAVLELKEELTGLKDIIIKAIKNKNE